jgi:hypothetical protein
VEEVVDDEVASHGAGGVDGVDIAGEEVADVAELKDEDGQPGFAGLVYRDMLQSL